MAKDNNANNNEEKTVGEEIAEQDDIQEDREVLDEETGPDENENGENDENEEEDEDNPLGPAGERAYERVKKERNELREQVRELEQKMESEDERKLREAREEAATEASTQWKTRFAKAEAKSALTAAGLTKAQDRVLALVDLDQVDVDDDGTVKGLDDQIASIKEDFPELFDGRKARKTKGDVGDKQAPNTPKTIGDQLAAQFNG